MITPRFIFIIGVAMAVFAGLFYIYEQGRRANEVDTLKIAVKETTQAVRDKQNAKKIVNKADDVDALLIELSIMRSDEDR